MRLPDGFSVVGVLFEHTIPKGWYGGTVRVSEDNNLGCWRAPGSVMQQSPGLSGADGWKPGDWFARAM